MSVFTGLEEKTSEELQIESDYLWKSLEQNLSEQNIKNVCELLDIEHELGMRGE
jgi:hypothetical protein